MKGAAESARARNAALTLAALLALIALVAIVSGGRAPGLGEHKPSASAPHFLADYVGTLALLMVPLGVLLFVVGAFQRRAVRARRGEPIRSPVWALVLVVVFLGGLGFRIVYRDWSHSGSEPVTRPGAHPALGEGQRGGPRTPPVEPHADVQWPLVFIFGSLVVAIVGTMGVLVLRRRRGLLEPPSTAAALAKVLDESVDDLRAEPDPRQAVIRTYARMERTFAARGHPREPFEAPIEYLVRMLDVVHASALSIRRLTQLFQRARFSTHGVDEGMKGDAIDSLDALRAELQAAAH